MRVVRNSSSRSSSDKGSSAARAVLKTRQFNLRFSENEYDMLQVISAATDLRMSDALRALVVQAYSALGPDDVRKAKERAAEIGRTRLRVFKNDPSKPVARKRK